MLTTKPTLLTNWEEKIVDVVSYNTVLKGFSAAKCSDRCFDCMSLGFGCRCVWL